MSISVNPYDNSPIRDLLTEYGSDKTRYDKSGNENECYQDITLPLIPKEKSVSPFTNTSDVSCLPSNNSELSVKEKESKSSGDPIRVTNQDENNFARMSDLSEDTSFKALDALPNDKVFQNTEKYNFMGADDEVNDGFTKFQTFSVSPRFFDLSEFHSMRADPSLIRILPKEQTSSPSDNDISMIGQIFLPHYEHSQTQQLQVPASLEVNRNTQDSDLYSGGDETKDNNKLTDHEVDKRIHENREGCDTRSPNSILDSVFKSTNSSPRGNSTSIKSISPLLSPEPVPSCTKEANCDRIRIETMHIAENPFAKEGRKTVVTARLAEDNPYAAAVSRLGKEFVSHKMKSGEGTVTGDRSKDFRQDLYAFISERGIPLRKKAVIGGGDLDLYRLLKQVMQLGGAKNVVRNRAFRVVADLLELPRSCTSSAYVLKQAYERHLFHYEEKFVLGIEPKNPLEDVNLKFIVKSENAKLASTGSSLRSKKKQGTQINYVTKKVPVSACNKSKKSILGRRKSSAPHNNYDRNSSSKRRCATNSPISHRLVTEDQDPTKTASTEQVIGEDAEETPSEIGKLQIELLSVDTITFSNALETFHKLLLQNSISFQHVRDPVEGILMRYADVHLQQPVPIAKAESTQVDIDFSNAQNIIQSFHKIMQTSSDPKVNLSASGAFSAILGLNILISDSETKFTLCLDKGLMSWLFRIMTHNCTHPVILTAVLELVLNLSIPLALNLATGVTPTNIQVISSLTHVLSQTNATNECVHSICLSILYTILSPGPSTKLTLPKIPQLTRYLLTNINDSNLCLLILERLSCHNSRTREVMLQVPNLLKTLVDLHVRNVPTATLIVRELAEEYRSHHLLDKYVRKFADGSGMTANVCNEILTEVFVGNLFS